MSETGIRAAEKQYGQFGITFAVADINTASFSHKFDCIFVRSCSLYNTNSFPFQTEVTSSLLRHLSSTGTFIFAYNSNFSSKSSPTWRYHSLEDAKQHFTSYPGAQIFFLNKITTILLRKYSFSPFLTRINMLLSRASRAGGDLVCILKEPRPVS
jgi:hypothetical protein